MKIKFTKYHALLNDFIIVENRDHKLAPKKLSSLAQKMCHRKSGVGADGLLYVTSKKNKPVSVDVYNADGGRAEKSGNGLRIAGLHLHLKNPRKREFIFEMGGEKCPVRFVKKLSGGGVLKTELGTPRFRSKDIPVKISSPFMINQPLKMGGVNFPVTCLSVGNPHAVMIVENFDFEWQQFGKIIENHRYFPKRTNVEFVKVLSRNKLELAEWERGVGATGSSGTGAAAAVAAAVVLGMADRKCRVEFEAGSLAVNWREKDNSIELTGPAHYVCQGVYEFL